MAKFGRQYLLLVETQDGKTLEIQLPFTLEFDITRKNFGSTNVASIRIFNLGTQTRNQIRYNRTDYGILRKVILQAGYQGSNLSTVFSGNYTQAWSFREGVNFITQIEAMDGGFAFSNATADGLPPFIAGTSQTTIISTLFSTLEGVTPGVIGPSFTGNISRGNSYSGPTTDVLRTIAGQGFFIDNSVAHCLANNECLEGILPVINSNDGLLGTPLREGTLLDFEMLFEPRLKIGQYLVLQSATDTNFNGAYQVISLKHRGTISEAVCGDAVTSVGLFAGLNNTGTVSINPLTIVGAA